MKIKEDYNCAVKLTLTNFARPFDGKIFETASQSSTWIGCESIANQKLASNLSDS